MAKSEKPRDETSRRAPRRSQERDDKPDCIKEEENEEWKKERDTPTADTKKIRYPNSHS